MLYITFEDVRIRLLGKVKFTTDPDDENKMQQSLAERLIEEAEGQVEHDLSPRYSTPFTLDGGNFAGLPDRPTKEILRTLCERMAVMKILDVDFGRGTVTGAEKYYETMEKRYKSTLDSLLSYRDGYGSGWKYPPLPGLKLNWGNAMADDGFTGQVYITGATDDGGDYPATHVNDPSKSFYNRRGG